MKRLAVLSHFRFPLIWIIGLLAFTPDALKAAQYHVSKNGGDASPGTQSQPLEPDREAPAIR